MSLSSLRAAAYSGILLLQELAAAILVRIRADRRRALFAAMTGLLLALAVFVLANARLHHTVDVVCFENCVYGADMREIYERAGLKGIYRTVDVNKHKLAAIVFAVGTKSLIAVGLSAKTAFLSLLAAICAVLSILLFLFCLRIGASIALAAASTAWFMSTNAVLSLASITETYILTLAAMTFALLVFLELEPQIERRPGWTALLGGTAAGIASLANTPAAAVALVYVWLAWRKLNGRPIAARTMLAVAIPCLLALLIGVVSTLRNNPTHPLSWQVQYAAQWASLTNFFSAQLLTDFWSVVLAFGWSSPFNMPMCRLISSDMIELLGRWPAISALGGSYTLLLWSVWRSRRSLRVARLWPGFMAAIAALLAFYIYFNPWETMLYAAQWQLLIICLAVAGLAGSRLAAPLVVAVAALGFLANDTIDWPLVTEYSQCCGLERSPPWGDQ